MNNVRHILEGLKDKRVSWRLHGKLSKMTMQTPTAEALAALDDEADLTELIKHMGLEQQPDVVMARTRHAHACGIAFERYEKAVNLSYQYAEHLGMDESDFVVLVVRRRDLMLLRGKFTYLRPVAEDIISAQNKAQGAWLRTVAASYAGYARVVADVMSKEVARVA